MIFYFVEGFLFLLYEDSFMKYGQYIWIENRHVLFLYYQEELIDHYILNKTPNYNLSAVRKLRQNVCFFEARCNVIGNQKLVQYCSN